MIESDSHLEWMKTDYHQVQLNKLYDGFIKEVINEIDGRHTTTVVNKILSIVRSKKKYTEEEIVSMFENDPYTDWSPWFTDGYPYKVFILISYYEWREYFKQNKLLVNYMTGKLLDEDLIK